MTDRVQTPRSPPESRWLEQISQLLQTACRRVASQLQLMIFYNVHSWPLMSPLKEQDDTLTQIWDVRSLTIIWSHLLEDDRFELSWAAAMTAAITCASYPIRREHSPNNKKRAMGDLCQMCKEDWALHGSSAAPARRLHIMPLQLSLEVWLSTINGTFSTTLIAKTMLTLPKNLNGNPHLIQSTLLVGPQEQESSCRFRVCTSL